MSKNKFTIITILTVIILALTVPLVRAEDEPTTDAQANPDSTIMPINENPGEPADSSVVQPNGSSETGTITDEKVRCLFSW